MEDSVHLFSIRLYYAIMLHALNNDIISYTFLLRQIYFVGP